MSIEIPPDDLVPGMIVTVHRWNDPLPPADLAKPPQDDDNDAQWVWSFQIVNHPEKRAGLMGMPLRLHRVELPYLLVEDPEGQMRVLDFREIHLMKLSQGYWDDVTRTMPGRAPAGTQWTNIPTPRPGP